MTYDEIGAIPDRDEEFSFWESALLACLHRKSPLEARFEAGQALRKWIAVRESFIHRPKTSSVDDLNKSAHDRP